MFCLWSLGCTSKERCPTIFFQQILSTCFQYSSHSGGSKICHNVLGIIRIFAGERWEADLGKDKEGSSQNLHSSKNMKKLLWPTNIPKSNRMFSTVCIYDHLASAISWLSSQDIARAPFCMSIFSSLAWQHHHAPKYYSTLEKNNNNKINKNSGPFCTEPTMQHTQGCTDPTLKLQSKYGKSLLPQQWQQEICIRAVKMQ